jgi:hypothetical protein
MMENTYTYTARNAEDTHEVVTFTLHNHHMSVDLGAPMENIETALESGAGGKEQIALHQPWAKPVTVALIEGGLRPFDISDVDADVENERLKVCAWIRAGGLRLAPIRFRLDQVDNPEATQAFVEELEQRKASAARSSRVPKWLDYWASWLFLGSLVILLPLIWLRRGD